MEDWGSSMTSLNLEKYRVLVDPSALRAYTQIADLRPSFESVFFLPSYRFCGRLESRQQHPLDLHANTATTIGSCESGTHCIDTYESDFK